MTCCASVIGFDTTTAATCASRNYANSDKSGGTGTATTTGTVGVVCDDGWSGSGNAVCTANGATSAAFVFAACVGIARVITTTLRSTHQGPILERAVRMPE